MRKLVYDVAVSLDGFISGPNDDVSTFLQEGEHAREYMARLAGYDTTVMGRATYEFGYAHGLKPGARAYPHMRHVIFSTSLQLPAGAAVEVARGEVEPVLRALKAEDGTDIYLCGGGALAGHCLRAGLVDRLILKVNPILLGRGTPLFVGAEPRRLRLVDSKRYDSGVVLSTFDL